MVGDLVHDDIDVVEKHKEIQQLLDDEGLSVFAEFNPVNNIVQGITTVSQANGIAGIESNTILVGWHQERHFFADFLRVMRYLAKLLAEIRIKADTKVFVKAPDKTIRGMIHEKSTDAEVVIFGLGVPEEGKEDTYVERLEELGGNIPAVFFVKK